MDYYQELGLSRSAGDADVKKAYRKLALKYHPDKDASDEASLAFARVAESYDVLINPKAKGCFDLYGEEGLKVGVPDGKGKGGKKGGFYTFDKAPLDIFNEFFGTANPYAALMDISSSFAAMTAEVANAVGTQKTYPVPVTLEDIFFGGEKVVPHTKTVVDAAGKKEVVEKSLTINIPPGCPFGERFVFEKEGNVKPNTEVGPVICVLELAKDPAPTFVRSGSDLIFTAKLPVCAALTGTVIPIKTLDGRTLKVPVAEVVETGQRKVVTGEGLPKVGGGGKGDLIILFELIYPHTLTEAQKEVIKAAFFLPAKPSKEAADAVAAFTKAFADPQKGWASGFPKP
mmetsp:Transcript_13241/g.45805  ORF Transcript_13241/g.45805 Transcript_13241/m.45805 type:complete len:343 (-) Transcript_13241:80-1108(-)